MVIAAPHERLKTLGLNSANVCVVFIKKIVQFISALFRDVMKCKN